MTIDRCLALGAVAAACIALGGAAADPQPGKAKPPAVPPAEWATPPRPVPYLLPFQGRLLNAKGEPVAEGKATAIFSIYKSPGPGGTADWTSGPVELRVEKGGLVHTVLGGPGLPLDKVDFGQLLYLGIKVHDPAGKLIPENAPEMLPRIQILPTLFARRAEAADHAKRADDTFFVQGINLFQTGQANRRLPAGVIDPAALVPPGTLMFYCGRIDQDHPVPAGWLVCDGSVVNGTDPRYAALVEAIGDAWGDAEDDDDRTVNLPDLRQTGPNAAFGEPARTGPQPVGTVTGGGAGADNGPPGPAPRLPKPGRAAGVWIVKH